MKYRPFVGIAAILLAAAGIQLADPAAMLAVAADAEVEPNDTFDLAQILPPGATGVLGNISPTGFNPLDSSATVVASSLVAGEVVSHDFTGMPAGEPFYAYLDNSLDSGVNDLVMQSLDASFSSSIVNDDSSPLGNGLAPGVGDRVNSDGTIHLEVSGFSDFEFSGDHTQSGEYDLYLQLGTAAPGDVDYYSFTGLVSGLPFTAEVIVGEPDTVLGLFDASGGVIDFDDDGGEGLLSRLDGTVPVSGEVTLAVSAYPDFFLNGNHFDTGPYELTFRVVPEPGTLGLVAVSLMAAAHGRRWR